MNIWEIGAAYEPYVGRWSRVVAAVLLNWLDVPPGSRWLDVGCGTGALTATILTAAEPQSVTGVDFSADFADYARAQINDPRATFVQGDAQVLQFDTGSYDAVVSGLVLNFLPRPENGLSEMVRVTRPGGVVAAYVWDYAGDMQFMRYFWDAASELDSSATGLDEGRRFPICKPEPFGALFTASGLADVEV